MAKPTLATFFECASPETLASLIADTQEIVCHASNDPDLQLEKMAMRALIENVGNDEAQSLINAASRV